MKMRKQEPFKFILWTLLTISSLHFGFGLDAKCEKFGPTLQQKQVSNSNPPKFMVEIYNSCPMCPVINIHLKCGNFAQSVVNPRLLKVLGYDDCVVNGGLPLQPLQKFSFNYSHHEYSMRPATWYFQCE